MERVIDTVETYIEDQHTYFLLESLEALREERSSDRIESDGSYST